MESTGAHRTKAMSSDGLRRRWRRRSRRTEAKTIRVESLSGHRAFSLELDLTETIAKVKARIYEQEGTHPTQQVLIFREQHLNDDHRTLADYGVQHGPSSSLLLDTRLHGGDPPEKEGTGSHCLDIMASEEIRRPSQGAKSIFVKTQADETIKLEEVDLSETIEGVKYMIFEKGGLPPESQGLIINGVHARKEWYTLQEYGFQYGTDIFQFLHQTGGGGAMVNIFVTKLDGETFTIDVGTLRRRISEVRCMIRSKEGIRLTQQHLVFRGQPLDDDRTLDYYNIQENSTLHMAPGRCGGNSGLHEKEGMGSQEAMASEELGPSQGAKSIDIVYTSRGMTIKLEEVDLSETIEGVKDMIFEKTGIHPSYQNLLIKGVGLARKEWYTLEEYGFQYGKYIILVYSRPICGGGPDPEINIFVTKLNGEIFTLMLYSLETSIYEVRRLIREQEGIRQTQQHLVFCGQPLDHDRTLADYNIQDNSILHLAPGPCGVNSGLHEPLSKDEDGLVRTGQAPGSYAVVNVEGSSHGHDQQFSGSQSQAPVAGHHEVRNEQIMEVVNDTASPADRQLMQQKIRWSKYSVTALLFAITTLVTYLGSASTLFSTGNMVFKICIGAFFIADALSIIMPPKMGSGLVYLSCFLLVVVSYLLLVSSNKHYGYAILPVPLPIVAALLQHKFLPGLTQRQRSNNNEGDQNADIEVSGQAHGADEEDCQHFDHIFELSAAIVNCGGLITVVFGNSMVGPVRPVGFLFFYTVSLGLYLMMVTTVRTEVLKPHVKYLAILLKFLLVITLITALIHGVQR